MSRRATQFQSFTAAKWPDRWVITGNVHQSLMFKSVTMQAGCWEVYRMKITDALNYFGLNLHQLISRPLGRAAERITTPDTSSPHEVVTANMLANSFTHPADHRQISVSQLLLVKKDSSDIHSVNCGYLRSSLWWLGAVPVWDIM